MTIHEDILVFAERMECQELHMVIDPPTGLRAVVAIHSTKLGPALGGCRWISYPTTEQAAIDAIRLAQGMTYKSAISGLNLGGGKAVLLRPDKPVDRTAYFQAFGRFLEVLNGRYITAVDMGTTTNDMDIIETQTSYVTSTTHGSYSSPNPSPLTALGVKRGIEAAVKHKLGKNTLEGVHVAIQGAGHVGSQLAKLLTNEHAKVSITDINNEAVKFCVDNFGVTPVDSKEDIYSIECDVFAPCALGASLNKESIPKIKAPIVAGAANNQLEEPEDAERLLERQILYAPDFVINAGGIIYVAGQHIKNSESETRDHIVQIYDILLKIFERADKEKQSTYEIAHVIADERLRSSV